MTDYPIIMSGPMVRALLAGRKTMTRRLLYSPRKGREGVPRMNCRRLAGFEPPSRLLAIGEDWGLTPWHKVKPGDRLWVRENLTCVGDGMWRWAADNQHIKYGQKDPRVPAMIAWAHHEERGSVPSIHMPRWASRITLNVETTKIEPVQDISEADAIAEGCASYGPSVGVPAGPRGSAADLFMALWSMFHGGQSWIDNPAVVAMGGNVTLANIDTLKEAA